ncbi:MAG: biotin/lipoyl-binding protein, partial [Sulfurospirillaceae bacterium]|nr:biotin/lipoyl-binding protein [Sulfurospirillaceae bacterium]
MLKKVFNKWTMLILFLGIVIAGYMVWKKNQQLPLEAKYTLQSVEMGDITQSVSANGTLNPLVLVTVGTQISGRVTKLYVDFNDRVKEGQVLAQLDRSLLDAQAAQSEANVKSAEAALELAIANNKRS